MLIRLLGIDGGCVHVYGVLLVGVLSRGVMWLMLCGFNEAHAPSPQGRKGGKNTKNNNNNNF